jgi:class 3 adenylate cyclase
VVTKKRRLEKKSVSETRKPVQFQRLRTQPTLRTALLDAQGRSEFVIVVFVDIRGFSKFSKTHESPDTAMFIKRFYLELIDNYFEKANFFKPTGDGLLMTFPYDDKTLLPVGRYVIEAAMRCLDEFPTMLKGDPMINFPIPENIGFGIARGTACCLNSGRTIIDYSGHLLNLSARLTELARPSGIVVDGGFQKEIIPQEYRDRFEDANVFIRSLAESEPIPVFILSDSVKLPKNALKPIEAKRWMTHNRNFKVSELRKLGPFFIIPLPAKADKDEPLKLSIITPMIRKGRVVKGYTTTMSFENFKTSGDHEQTGVRINLNEVADAVEKMKVPRTKEIKIRISYVAEEYP